MFFMSCRLEYLKAALTGYLHTGVPLVAYQGQNFVPFSSLADDMGLYYFVPRVAHYLHISTEQAIYTFFYTLIGAAALTGLIGFFKLFKSAISRVIATVGVAGISLLTARMVDVYVAYEVAVVGLIPLFLWFALQNKVTKKFMAWMFMSGVVIGLCHYIRAYSSVATLIFMLTLMLLYMRAHFKQKLLLVAALCVGLSVPVLYSNYIFKQYTHYIQTHEPQALAQGKAHVFWHAVYLGFSFLSNDLGIVWDDKCGAQKALTISADAVYPSQKYETVMKYEVFNLVKHHIKFVLYTLFAKLGILLMYLVLFANIGLLAAWCYRKPWQIEFAFLLALGFNALFGVLVMPFPQYLLGFIAVAAMYGIYSIGYALERGAWHDIKNIFFRSSRVPGLKPGVSRDIPND